MRTHDEEETELLEREMAEKFFLGEEELAAGMNRYVLKRYEKTR